MNPESLLALWRAANARATEAEDALFAATIAYLDGKGPIPGPELGERATALRQAANELLDRAVRMAPIGQR